MADLDDKLQSILEDWYPGTQYSEVIPQIKQVFEVEGMKKWGEPISEKELAEIKITNLKDFQTMTGKEWLDRFKKEVDDITVNIKPGSPKSPWTGFLDSYGVEDFLEAAQRAAGIEGGASLSTD